MPTRGRTYAQTMFFHLRHEIWSQPSRCVEAALSPIREPTAFSAEQARTAGSLVAQTRALALSLGDRACLALGPCVVTLRFRFCLVCSSAARNRVHRE